MARIPPVMVMPRFQKFFAQSRPFDRITWAGRHYSLCVLQHHFGLFWNSICLYSFQIPI
jgi:hypothetical protein